LHEETKKAMKKKKKLQPATIIDETYKMELLENTKFSKVISEE